MTACATCGDEIVYTTPSTHVYSTFTGSTYCLTCCVNGGPVKGQKRRRKIDVATATKGKVTAKPKAESGPDLAALLAVELAAIDGVTLEQKKGYSRIVKGGKTVGYINGTRKLRVDFPTGNAGYDQLTADSAKAFPKIVKRVTDFVPPAPKPKAAPKKAAAKPKATAKKRTTKPKKDIVDVVKDGIAAAVAASPDVEVTPDPK